MLYIKEKIEQKDKEIAELKKPLEQHLTEFASLKKENEKLVTLENDNMFLRHELVKVKNEPLTEKCAWQAVQLSKKDEEIKRLKEHIAQKIK